jgi:uncharacterized protein DUF4440
MADRRSEDDSRLREINEGINRAENHGDRDWLATRIAPQLAFQRADDARTVDDRDAFLEKVKPGGTRVSRVLEPIQVFGDRAIVQCIVTVAGKDYHNLRLFVRRDGDWQLLGWANEAV